MLEKEGMVGIDNALSVGICTVGRLGIVGMEMVGKRYESLSMRGVIPVVCGVTRGESSGVPIPGGVTVIASATVESSAAAARRTGSPFVAC